MEGQSEIKLHLPDCLYCAHHSAPGALLRHDEAIDRCISSGVECRIEYVCVVRLDAVDAVDAKWLYTCCLKWSRQSRRAAMPPALS